MEKNRRDVEEKSEQLKAVSNLAALFAGFAVVTLTQFAFDQATVSVVWIAFYGVLTNTRTVMGPVIFKRVVAVAW